MLRDVGPDSNESARVISKVAGWDDAITALLDPPTKLVIAREAS